MIEKSGKRKAVATNIQGELESNSNPTETILALAMERNVQIEGPGSS